MAIYYLNWYSRIGALDKKPDKGGKCFYGFRSDGLINAPI